MSYSNTCGRVTSLDYYYYIYYGSIEHHSSWCAHSLCCLTHLSLLHHLSIFFNSKFKVSLIPLSPKTSVIGTFFQKPLMHWDTSFMKATVYVLGIIQITLNLVFCISVHHTSEYWSCAKEVYYCFFGGGIQLSFIFKEGLFNVFFYLYGYKLS